MARSTAWRCRASELLGNRPTSPWQARKAVCFASLSPSSHGVLHAYDFKTAHAVRRLKLEAVAFALADQRARERRVDGDEALLDVGFEVADDLIGNLIAAGFLDQIDGRAEYDPAVGAEARNVDHFGEAQRSFEFLDAAFDESLQFARGVILGVFLQIAVRTRFGNLRNDARPLLGLQPIEFAARALGALRGHWRTLHASPFEVKIFILSILCVVPANC